MALLSHSVFFRVTRCLAGLAELKQIPIELIYYRATNSVCSPAPCGEGLGVGVGVDLPQNILKYPVNIRQHIVIPISQDLIAVRRKGLRAFLIGS